MTNLPPAHELEDWFMTPLGQTILQWEREKNETIVSNAFGYHAVQIGMPSVNFLRSNRMRTKTILTEEDPDSYEVNDNLQYLQGSVDEIPLPSDSVDLVILPHTLELNNNPHGVLREIDRILVHDGRIVIMGFNPRSLWGLCNICGFYASSPIKNKQQVSVGRVKDWLQLLSFEIDRGHFGAYIPPCRTLKWLKRWEFMNKAGNRWWPAAGAVYILSAKKYTVNMRLIGPAWRRKKRGERRAATVAQKLTEKNLS